MSLRGKVIVLADERQGLTTDIADKALKGYGVSVEIDSVAHELAALAEVIAGAEIIMTFRAALDANDELESWIRSLAPMADLWQVTPDGYVDSAPEEFDDSIALSMFTGSGATLLRERLKRRLHQKEVLARVGIVSRSARMGVIAETLERVAPTDVSVLVSGPSGSGKEMIARAIHQLSDRNRGPFVAVNCGAIPEGLIESELFGHEKGAFTGSVAKRQGYFAQADGGTLLLDEIGEMKPDMQVKLLRAIEEGIFYPLGSEKPQRVNVRFIAATNRDLEEAINTGEFRDDLYFRLSGVKITMPSLSERPEDILPLLVAFSEGTHLSGYSPEAISELQGYSWPGNVRQLRNFVSRMNAMVGDGEVTAKDAREYINEQRVNVRGLPVISGPQPSGGGVEQELVYRALLQLGAEVKGLRELLRSHIGNESTSAINGEKERRVDAASTASLEEMEAKLLTETLRATGGNRRLTAERLGIGERTLYRKLKKYGLS